MIRTATLLILGLIVLLVACQGSDERHDHSAAHPAGHDHHEEGHGHDAPVVSTTQWSDQFELFIEHEPAVVGRATPLLLHVTVLKGFRPLTNATLTLALGGPSVLVGETATPVQPGIFRIEVTPPMAGIYRGRLQVDGDIKGSIEGVELEVHAAPEEEGEQVSEGDEGVIEFLKEQQWGVPFATAFVQDGIVVSSVEVAGRIETPPGGRAEVDAPVTGRVVVSSEGLPRPGTTVRKGQVLASLLPAPSSPEEAVRASLDVAEAEARVMAARAALDRAERLIRDEAIPQRDLEDTRREARVAKEALRTAKRAAQLFSGAGALQGEGRWDLTAPIDGTLVSVDATPGATVSPGTALFRIVDTSELWIVARVPEQDAARLRTDRDASFQIAGLDTWIPIDITGDDANASIVTIGRTVDPVSRTVDVIYALHRPNDSLRVGGLVLVSMPAGEEFGGVVVPRSALVDQEGRTVVYVQVDGEHFEERLVRTGPRAGTRVAIRDGLRAGERIVTEGAHLVRLAERAANAQPHGHIH